MIALTDQTVQLLPQNTKLIIFSHMVKILTVANESNEDLPKHTCVVLYVKKILNIVFLKSPSDCSDNGESKSYLVPSNSTAKVDGFLPKICPKIRIKIKLLS